MRQLEMTTIPTPDGWSCEVTVRDAAETTHLVHVSRAELTRLAPSSAGPEHLVRASFMFLLEREPSQAILSEFDIALIGRYFPDYEREIRGRLRG